MLVGFGWVGLGWAGFVGWVDWAAVARSWGHAGRPLTAANLFHAAPTGQSMRHDHWARSLRDPTHRVQSAPGICTNTPGPSWPDGIENRSC